MGTVKYTTYIAYLVVDRFGNLKVRKREGRVLAYEYVFRIVVKVPVVQRPATAGEVVLELPPDVDPDAVPAAEVAGPLEGGDGA